MVKWNVWRSAVAGAVIGFVEVAGLGAVRPAARGPRGVVRIDHQPTPDPLTRLGVWFLDPLANPRPAAADRRPAGDGPLRLLRLHPARLLQRLARRDSSS